MDSLGGEENEDSGIGLHQDRLAGVTLVNHKGSSKVHSSSVKGWGKRGPRGW